MNIVELANGTIPAESLNITATNGTTPINLADRFNLMLNVKDFGAVGDGVTDDSAAIQEAFTYGNSFLEGASWPLFPRSKSAIYFPPGKYVVNTGITISDCNCDIVANKAVTSISLAAGQYFLTVTASVYWFGCVDALRIYGGSGPFKFTKTGINVWNGCDISGNDFINYTTCAIGILSADFPYKTIERNFFMGSNTLTSIGIAFAGDSTRSSIRNNRMLCNRYHMKLVESNMLISDNDMIRYNNGGGSPSLVDIWFTGETSISPANKNVVIQNNKFGNENFYNSDIRILLADEGAGTDYTDKYHATTVSTRWHDGLTFKENHHGNMGGAIRGFIYSYCDPAYLPGLCVDDALAYTYPYIIECDAVVPASGSTNLNSQNGVIYGRTPGFDFDKVKPIPICNRIHGHVVIDEVGMLGSLDQTPTAYPSDAVALYTRLLSETNEKMSAWGNVSTSVVAIADSRGGTNASTVTAAASDAYTYRGLTLGSVVVGRLAWVEVDLKKSSSLPVDSVKVAIRNSGGSAFYIRTVELTDSWRSYRFPWVPGQNATYLAVSVQVNNYSAGVATNYDVGNPRVYHAQNAVSRDTRVLTNYRTWDPSSVANGATTTTTLTITGAVIGDFVLASFSLPLDGLSLTGYVSASDTVTVVLANATGSPVDLGSGTLTAKVFRNL